MTRDRSMEQSSETFRHGKIHSRSFVEFLFFLTLLGELLSNVDSWQKCKLENDRGFGRGATWMSALGSASAEPLEEYARVLIATGSMSGWLSLLSDVHAKHQDQCHCIKNVHPRIFTRPRP